MTNSINLITSHLPDVELTPISFTFYTCMNSATLALTQSARPGELSIYSVAKDVMGLALCSLALRSLQSAQSLQGRLGTALPLDTAAALALIPFALKTALFMGIKWVLQDWLVDETRQKKYLDPSWIDWIPPHILIAFLPEVLDRDFLFQPNLELILKRCFVNSNLAAPKGLTQRQINAIMRGMQNQSETDNQIVFISTFEALSKEYRIDLNNTTLTRKQIISLHKFRLALFKQLINQAKEEVLVNLMKDPIANAKDETNDKGKIINAIDNKDRKESVLKKTALENEKLEAFSNAHRRIKEKQQLLRKLRSAPASALQENPHFLRENADLLFYLTKDELSALVPLLLLDSELYEFVIEPLAKPDSHNSIHDPNAKAAPAQSEADPLGEKVLLDEKLALFLFEKFPNMCTEQINKETRVEVFKQITRWKQWIKDRQVETDKPDGSPPPNEQTPLNEGDDA